MFGAILWCTEAAASFRIEVLSSWALLAVTSAFARAFVLVPFVAILAGCRRALAIAEMLVPDVAASALLNLAFKGAFCNVPCVFIRLSWV